MAKAVTLSDLEWSLHVISHKMADFRANCIKFTEPRQEYSHSRESRLWQCVVIEGRCTLSVWYLSLLLSLAAETKH